MSTRETAASPAPQPTSATPAAPTRFVLVRHGEASGNRELRYLGSSDVPLTERGQQQARQLAGVVGAYALDALYTSPLQRARATAEAIASATGLTVREWADLREEDFGAWERMTRAEVLASDGERLAAWESGAATAPPGGESLADVRARVVASAAALAAQHPGATMALVSHVGPIKALLCAALDLPLSGARRIWLDPASISVVEWRPPSGTDASFGASGLVRVVNAVAHLDPPVRWLARERGG